MAQWQDDGDEQGRPCARGEWCASASRVRQEDGTTARVPLSGPRAFCDADRGIIATVLAALAATYRRLARALGDHVTAEVLTRVPFGPSCPLRGDVDELMRLIVDAVMTWRERVARVARLSVPDTQRWRARSLGPSAGTLVTKSAPVLAAHVDVLLALEPQPMIRPACSPVARSAPVLSVAGDTALVEAGGRDAGLEVLALDWRARSALLETPPAPARLLGVPCRGCERRALVLAAPPQHEGDQCWYSACAWCRDVMTEPEYRAWTRAWAAYYGQRVTPAMMAASRASAACS